MTTQFIQNKKYKADITLTLAQVFFATNAIIAEKLDEAGFKEITVTGSGTKRKAEGIWRSATQKVDIEKKVSPAIISNITEL